MTPHPHRTVADIITHLWEFQRNGTIPCGSLFGELEASVADMMRSLPDDIRKAGWTVAVHNDYRLHGEFHTFWLFTRGDRAVKGEGRSDAEALDQIRLQIGLLSKPGLTD